MPPRDDALIGLVELMFFAYRDFTGEADAVLQELEFGRAHHRVLHFVNRRPGLRVADLLDILRITKQSLARVLKELVDRGYVTQAAGAHDRRERRLYLTQKGKALADRLSQLQVARIAKALEGADGRTGDDVVRAFLVAMIAPELRASVSATTAPKETS
jgi:DNA-binding MarR family transcriptional regulator